MKDKQINLDKVVAEVGFKLAEKFREDDPKKFENIATKALGVLIEDGLFAFAVWLESRGEEERKYSKHIISASLNLLSEILNVTGRGIISVIKDDISPNLEKMLLARNLLERMLIYTRYRAKALSKNKHRERYY